MTAINDRPTTAPATTGPHPAAGRPTGSASKPSIRPSDPAPPAPHRPSRADVVARRAAFRLLGHVRGGTLTIVDDEGSHEFGDPDSGDHRVSMVVRDPRTWRVVLTGGGKGLGRSYRDGWWDTEDLVGLVELAIRSGAPLDRAWNRWHRATRPVTDPWRRLRGPGRSKKADREMIQAHYDLGNDFFSLFLDPTLTYSAAVFDGDDTSLEAAQVEKLDRLCRKLDLQPGEHLLEVGTGWGSLAIHAATHYGVQVTTTTLSDEQHAMATRRVSEAGLDDRITVLLDDYRDLTGTYDAAVSVEMIEAIDWRDHDTYFSKVAGLLKPTGRFAVQAITMADQRYERAKHTTDFIKDQVFPGGCLPSVTAMSSSATRASDLRLLDLEDLGLHYAETLRRWDDAFCAAGADARRSVGSDEQLSRLWRFYLAYCEAAFRQRHVSVVQLVWARADWRPSGLGVRPA